VWGGGFLGTGTLTGGKMVLDFAGGTVVHINAGVAGLVCALVLGKRKGFGTTNMAPHNLVISVIGASLLWVGWFGFNAGSELAADGLAGAAMINTQVATAAAALAWMFAEWIIVKKPSVLGIISGAVAGLVAVTPASGFVNVTGAFVIGIVAGGLCYYAAAHLKKMLGYDDSLDAFGVHGIGGIVGALLTGFFADPAVNGKAGLFFGNAGQVWTQIEGIAVTIVWTAVVSWIILMIARVLVGLRPSEQEEEEGLDITQHGESIAD
jgi:Amt family ammonium transporter